MSVGIVGAGPGGPGRRRAAAPQGLRGRGLRPLRPRRRPADLRHPQLQAGKGDRAAPRDSCCEQAGIVFHLNCEVGRDVTPRRAARAPRRRADRHRRLQGARHRRPRRRAARHRRGARLPHRLQPQRPRRHRARLRLRRARRRAARTSSWSAAATPRWTACAPRCARAPTRSNASIAATAPTCRARMREVKQRRGGRRGVRLALRAGGVSRQRSGDRRARDAHAPRPARRLRPAEPRRRSRAAIHRAGRPGDQGARLRSRGPAGDASASPSWR